MNEPGGPLAIICGGGKFPFVVADAVTRRGREVLLFAVRGWADPSAVASAGAPTASVRRRFQRIVGLP
jgi:DUF1009 family protein